MRVSVIIPALNEQDAVKDCIEKIRLLDKDVEIILVDGGSEDQTVTIARSLNVQVADSPKGRGIQCNKGAQRASGEILLFLHVDSCFSLDAFEVIDKYFSRKDVLIGTFRMQFDHPHWLLKFYGQWAQIDSLFTRFGDQCIVVRKTFLEELGGFADSPLFEDVDFLRRARKKTKIVSFPSIVTTSARRFMENGIVRQQWRNGLLLGKYLRGVSPEKLAHEYSGKKA